MFYEVMPKPVEDLERATRLLVRWLGCDAYIMESYAADPEMSAALASDAQYAKPVWSGMPDVELYVDPAATFADVLTELRRKVRLVPL